MNKELLYRDLGIQLDLALEAHDLLRGSRGGEVPGVSLTEQQHDIALVKNVTILNNQGAQIMQKPIGKYLTVESDVMKINNHAYHHQLSEVLAETLKEIMPFKSPEDSVLIVGLGNWNATPDALGPKIVDKTMATRHLFGRMPDELTDGLRPVSSIAPGVLGITGLETAEVLRGIVDRTRPSVIIAIDALAAGDVSRIGTTIQISNTGINPGSGVGNHRTGINQETMGVPVIAIGVPTVVHAGIIANNIIESFMAHLENRPHVSKILTDIPQPMIKTVIDEVLNNDTHSLTVTPKEIDDLINNTANIISKALTSALHPHMNEDLANCFV